MQADDNRVQSRMFGPNLTQRPQLLETRTPSHVNDRGSLSSPRVSGPVSIGLAGLAGGSGSATIRRRDDGSL